MRNNLLGAAAVVSFLATGAAASTELFFDDFESSIAGSNSTLSNWNITRGSIDVVGPAYAGNYGICATAAETCVDLDGSTRTAGRIESRSLFTFDVGRTYTLSFDYSENAHDPQKRPNTMTFGVGGVADLMTAGGPAAAGTYFSRTLSFDGDGSSGRIFFDHQGGDYFGISIDNVRLSSALSDPSPVPLPASAPLLALGAAALAALRRRRG